MPSAPKIVLKLPQGHESSKYVLSFEIGQQEGGFYSARTDTQTHQVAHLYIDIIYIYEYISLYIETVDI